MKVLLLITKGEIGGAQTHVMALCQALSTRVQFAAVIGGAEPRTALGDGLWAIGVPVFQLLQLGNSLSPLRLLSAVRALRVMLRQQQPDVIHAHSAVAGVVARIAGRVANIPVIYTVHGFGFKPEVPRLQRRVAWLAEAALAPWTRHMICVSAYERELARSLPLAPGRVSVIANAVADVAERAHPGQEAVRIVMVARLAKPKRPDLLLLALALLRERLGHEVPATLLGSGPDGEALRSLAVQLKLHSVDFAGDVDDVPQRLAQHAVFVLMSDHEGLPISVIEAMRAGLAMVCSDLPGLRELIAHGENGLLVPNDAGALAQALAQLLSSAPLRAQLGQAARLSYEARFTPDQMALPVAALYTQVTDAYRKESQARQR